MNDFAQKIIHSRADLMADLPIFHRAEDAAEGGCGVLGFAANIPVAGQHVLKASRQMHNRGNGKGGGIAMVGLDPVQTRVDRNVLNSHYMLQIALLDNQARREIEEKFLEPYFDVTEAYELDHLDDFREVEGLSVCPPDVVRYFVRVKTSVLEQFAINNKLSQLPYRSIEDEFVYQNSYRLNRQFYASLGEKRAFVLSHGRNLSVLKIVGYAEDVVAYYQLQEQTAHVWIAHQRYPTKGRVWHPGGAHPFIGLNEALVHNGDFANYHSVGEYLRQRNIGQLFLTDTEVSVQLFDLWNRVYGYPLEITLEALAPTTEYDYLMLPDEKKAIYRAVQRTHIHGSPDGPWFFILARSLPDPESSEISGDVLERYELLGITDTSMLRPQVFALYENLDPKVPVQIGLIASERQAINACLRSLTDIDSRFQPLADQYWIARGGSHTDGGAFRFSVEKTQALDRNPVAELKCSNKFGQVVGVNRDQHHVDIEQIQMNKIAPIFRNEWEEKVLHAYDDGGVSTFWNWLHSRIVEMNWNQLAWGTGWLVDFAKNGNGEWSFSLGILNLLRDRHYDSGVKKRASTLRIVDSSLNRLFEIIPLFDSYLVENHQSMAYRLDWESRQSIQDANSINKYANNDTQKSLLLVIDASSFPAEGEDSIAQWIVRAYHKGWEQIIVYNWRGGRFAGCGIGPNSEALNLHLYGDTGDYAASGLDGGKITIHGNGQDQLGQILKSGKLVIHGDAGQTFLYGAKGGEIYVSGSVAGRPLINGVGQPRAIINGTCLDYLAESFMAGDPHNGGGFVILNGVAFDDHGNLVELDTPYPGGNLFSLASGGAIFLRDPHEKVNSDQLNGGEFSQLSQPDWELIEPYLKENERLFDIRIEDLLTVDGERLDPQNVYRKVESRRVGVLIDVQNR